MKSLLGNRFAVYVAGVLTIAAMLAFKNNPQLITASVVLISVALFFREPTTTQALKFAVLFVSSLVVEILVVQAGVWAYSVPDAFGIPFWIPFVWVNGGLVFMQLKEDVERKMRRRI